MQSLCTTIQFQHLILLPVSTIHPKHELKKEKKKSNTSHNAFANVGNVAKTPNLPYNYISRARSR